MFLECLPGHNILLLMLLHNVNLIYNDFIIHAVNVVVCLF